MKLRLVSDSRGKLVVEHDPVAGAVGFRLSPVVKDGARVEGKWAHTWDGAATTHTFKSGFPPYQVEALMPGDSGVWPPPVQPLVPSLHTSYANLALGDNLDPLWWYRGSPNGAKHVGGNATIQIVNDPLGARGHVQRHIVHSGDVLWGGDRCEVMSERIGGSPGAHFKVAFGLLLPSGFQSDGGGWNSLWDLHYPNDGPAQSPITASIRNSRELWLRVLGGPLTSDGTMGTVRNERKVADLAQGVWTDLEFEILMDATAGLCNVRVNGADVTPWGKIPTVSPGVPNSVYWKQGFYRPANSTSGTQTYYFSDTACTPL